MKKIKEIIWATISIIAFIIVILIIINLGELYNIPY